MSIISQLKYYIYKKDISFSGKLDKIYPEDYQSIASLLSKALITDSIYLTFIDILGFLFFSNSFIFTTN